MKKIRTQSGFTAVEVVIVIVVLIVIGGVGWLVYDHNHKKTTPESSSTSSSQQTASTSKLKTATKPAKTADPYAGWKSFCSSQGGLCLKYPANWQYKQSMDTSVPGGPEVNTVTSPSGKVIVVYKPNWQISGPGGSGVTFKVTKVTPAESSDFEAVKLLFNCLTVQASTPYTACYANEFAMPVSNDYRVSDKNVSYAEGKTVTGYGDGEFYNPHATGKAAKYIQRIFVTNDSQQFAEPGFPTSAAAQAWLNSPDVTTAYKILTSVYYK